MYYKTKESNLISHIVLNQDKKQKLLELNNFDANGRTVGYSDDYLIIPIRLSVKLTENDPQQALQAQQTLMSLFVRLEEFGITIQKSQYDNVQMLLELTNDYVRFLSTYSLQKRKSNLKALNTLLKSLNYEETTSQIRDLYQGIFEEQLKVILAQKDSKNHDKTM